MGLWETIKNSFDQDRQYFTYFRIPPNQVTDRQFKPQALQSGLHYFRIWLPAMYLGKRVSWFQTVYPAVHSIVTANFSDKQGLAFPTLADPLRLGFQAAGGQGEVIARNFPLTPLLPFIGGTVTLQCGLIALDGYNHLSGFLKTLSSFSNLLAVPQISSALSIVEPLLGGMQDLFGAGNGKLHLGLMETFTAETLYEGYIGIVRAAHHEIDLKRMFVARDLLWYADGSNQLQPLPFDHMLLRIEATTRRDDWDSFPSIANPYKESINALGAQDTARSVEHLRAALLAAFKAPELTQAHRRVVIDELKRRYAAAKESLSLPTAGVLPDNAEFMSFGSNANEGAGPDEDAPPHDPTEDAFAKGPIEFNDVFGNLG